MAQASTITASVRCRAEGRDAWLDMLRAIAVIGVIGRHMTVSPESAGSWLHNITSVWREGGWVGVDLFFVLSGYLVSGLLFNEARKRHRVDVGRFLIRRGFKIYPAFWFVLCLTIAARLVLHAPVTGRDVAGEILFLQNYLGKITGPHWTLAVEEHFYLLLGAWIWWQASRPWTPGTGAAERFSTVPWAFACVAVTCLGFRVWGYGSEDYWRDVMKTHVRIDSLMFGVLLSWATHFGPLADRSISAAWRFGLMVAGACLFIPAFAIPWEGSRFMGVWSYNGFYVGGGLLILAGIGRRWSGGFASTLARVGACSYGIYLCHDPWQRYFVLKVLNPTASTPAWWLYFCVYAFGAIGGGMLLTSLIERPALRLRDRLFPRREVAL